MTHLTKNIANGTELGMENFCRDYLLTVAKAYGEAKGLDLATVSRRFHGAVWFLKDFKKGKVSVTLRKYDDMLTNFAADWPEGVKWPVIDKKKLSV